MPVSPAIAPDNHTGIDLASAHFSRDFTRLGFSAAHDLLLKFYYTSCGGPNKKNGHGPAGKGSGVLALPRAPGGAGKWLLRKDLQDHGPISAVLFKPAIGEPLQDKKEEKTEHAAASGKKVLTTLEMRSGKEVP